jgi:outer membrane protein TolC
MSTTAWWILVGAGLLLGVAGGGWMALQIAGKRFDARLKRASEEIHQRHVAMGEQLRAANVRAQVELEQSRSAFKRQLAAMAAEPRAALERSEDRLKAAYAELDRLRGKSEPERPELSQGFAATEPMQKGM